MKSFHRNGRCYEVESATLEQPLGRLARFLPAGLYNPPVRIAYRFKDLGGYSIEELVAGVEAAIRQDDDILTQFREKADLLGRLAGAKTFDAVASVLAYARVGV